MATSVMHVEESEAGGDGDGTPSPPCNEGGSSPVIVSIGLRNGRLLTSTSFMIHGRDVESVSNLKSLLDHMEKPLTDHDSNQINYKKLIEKILI